MIAISRCLLRCLLALLLGLGMTGKAGAHHTAEHEPAVLRQVGLDQRLQEFIPLDLPLRDARGRPVLLGDYFGSQPVLLTLAYYHCPNLCPLVLDGLLRSMRALPLTLGEHFQVVTVSINPADTSAMAAAKQAHYVQGYGRPEAARGWHFLTAEPEAIQRLTQAVGFRYVYDAARDEFVHASGIMLLTPQGQLARYFYGVEYAPRDVRLGLVEAASQKIGSPIDQLLLLCYHYDPQSGTYTMAIRRTLRLAGAATVLALGMFIGVLWRRERYQSTAPINGPGGQSSC